MIATCQPDGTYGPCECLPGPDPGDPPSAQDTAACLGNATTVFSDPCADCVCNVTKLCAQGIATCQGDCLHLLSCIASCVPDGLADIHCVTKCTDAYPPAALSAVGMAVPNCVGRCPEVCLDGFKGPGDASDADGGAG